MPSYNKIKTQLKSTPKTWLITGVAGFIGSNLLETLLALDQTVIGLDNFSTGYQRNLDEVKQTVTPAQWNRFTFIKGDIRDLETCRAACANIDYVLHQAALGSVPRSIENPILTNDNNITGFLNMLVAARDANVKRFVYAASSSTYGDHPGLPKVEDRIGRPLSPYAVTKYVNELYADVFARTYGVSCIGLRYFNVFGKRQDPNGAYAAVIPKWFSAMLTGETVFINGDGETSRDFCYIDNCVQANILAATTQNPDAVNQVYNVAFGERTTLNELFEMIKNLVIKLRQEAAARPSPLTSSLLSLTPNLSSLIYRDFRPGDVKHSLADISKARQLLGYSPVKSVKNGLNLAAAWYAEKFMKERKMIKTT